MGKSARTEKVDLRNDSGDQKEIQRSSKITKTEGKLPIVSKITEIVRRAHHGRVYGIQGGICARGSFDWSPSRGMRNPRMTSKFRSDGSSHRRFKSAQNEKSIQVLTR